MTWWLADTKTLHRCVDVIIPYATCGIPVHFMPDQFAEMFHEHAHWKCIIPFHFTIKLWTMLCCSKGDGDNFGQILFFFYNALWLHF